MKIEQSLHYVLPCYTSVQCRIYPEDRYIFPGWVTGSPSMPLQALTPKPPKKKNTYRFASQSQILGPPA
jgi:hypothetical protein